MCNYIRETGVKANFEYYQCNRAGIYRHKGKGERRIKSQGTVYSILLIVGREWETCIQFVIRDV